MQSFLFYILLLSFFTRCQSAGTANNPLPSHMPVKTLTAHADTVIPRELKPYSGLTYVKTELLGAAPGTKSVVFNSAGTRLYAMNLEGMSVYEFDQPTRKLTREFKFKPTRGTGWDYSKNKPIASYQEKPVEACFSHDDKILWVSLHNAEGIVPIWVDSFKAKSVNVPGQAVKPITVIYPGTNRKDSFLAPLIHTGKTPKVISRTADSKYLLVSNWHSYNVSVLELNKDLYPFGKVVSTIPVSSIPRGVVVDDKFKKSYVAIMGGASIAVIDNETWKMDSIINVAANPRHIVMDSTGRIFVSYNSLGKIACIDAYTGNTLFTADTHSQPRTIMMSKNQQFLFVTCYSGNMVDVYKIYDSRFEKIASLPCNGSPVGVDIYEDNDTLEAWVCSYAGGFIRVFTFQKN
jgi:DNA-binding beta-propeller fold protein YncE